MIYEDENENDIDLTPAMRAVRRKNEWKHAIRHARILTNQDYDLDKPLHYYSKTRPEFYYQRKKKTNNKGKHRTAYGNYYPAKNWSSNDRKKIDNAENQLEELFDE